MVEIQVKCYFFSIMKTPAKLFIQLSLLTVAACLFSACQSAPYYGGSGSDATPSSRSSSSKKAPGSASRYGWARPETGESSGHGPLPSTSIASVPKPEPRRPGLGTGWGEDRTSRVNYTSFQRGSKSQPRATGRLYYNDDDGAQAMASQNGFSWGNSGPVTLAGSMVSVGLQSSRGRWLKSFSSGGDRFFVGDAGDRYQISIRNRTRGRLEIVVSVDGLDVMDGKSASPSKRGYIIAPGAELKVEGFRQSEHQVAAFRFSSVDSSYSAKKHGSTRNVGVIGVAVFSENGRDPWQAEDTALRRNANPFPGSRFATAP